MAFRITEGELRKIGRTTYNARGYILLEWGRNNQHHFRFDLDRNDRGRFQELAGSEYQYYISSIHLKYDIQEATQGDMDHSYFYVVYMGGGVWQPIWTYAARTNPRTGQNTRFTSSDSEQSADYRMMNDLLDDLSQATGTTQAMACGPTLGPADVPAFVPRG